MGASFRFKWHIECPHRFHLFNFPSAVIRGSCGDRGMPHQFLEQDNVSSPCQHFPGKCSAKIVRCGLRESNRLRVALHDKCDRLWADWGVRHCPGLQDGLKERSFMSPTKFHVSSERHSNPQREILRSLFSPLELRGGCGGCHVLSTITRRLVYSDARRPPRLG